MIWTAKYKWNENVTIHALWIPYTIPLAQQLSLLSGQPVNSTLLRCLSFISYKYNHLSPQVCLWAQSRRSWFEEIIKPVDVITHWLTSQSNYATHGHYFPVRLLEKVMDMKKLWWDCCYRLNEGNDDWTEVNSIIRFIHSQLI